jgi:hypothetical protein
MTMTGKHKNCGTVEMNIPGCHPIRSIAFPITGVASVSAKVSCINEQQRCWVKDILKYDNMHIPPSKCMMAVHMAMPSGCK